MIEIIQAVSSIGWPGALVTIVLIIVGGWVIVTLIKNI